MKLSIPDLAKALLAERVQIAERVTYRSLAGDPVGFIQALGERCWSRQAEIARAVRERRFVAVPSCHASGKSWVLARLVLWWVLSHQDPFVVASAPTDSQVRSILWRELRAAHEKAGLPGTLTASEWRIGGRLVAMGRKPADYSEASFQGIHARNVLVILDEASGISEALWTQAETLVANEGSRMVVAGNPTDPSGRFAKACRTDSVYARVQISAFDTPAFTGEAASEELLESLISPAWVAERSEAWGEESNLYRARVLGRFPQQREDALFELAWIERARTQQLGSDGWARLGVDVARYGSSESVIYCLRGACVRLVSARRGEDTSRTSGRIIRALADEGAAYASVDEVGVGGGVVDALRASGYPVYGVSSSSSPNSSRFANKRAEIYWGARELLRTGQLDLDPDDEALAEQLALIRYHINPSGKILIESKEDMRRQGRPSPDRADAFVLSTLAWYVVEEEEDDDDEWGPIHISDF